MATTLPSPQRKHRKQGQSKANLPTGSRKRKSRTVGRKLRPAVLLLLITALLLGGIGSRLGYLQLVEGERNRQLAENNRIRILPKPPVRGNILDRNGKILADSRLSYSVFIWPLAKTEPNWNHTVNQLAEILEMSAADIISRVEEVPVNSPSLVRIARGLTPEQVTAIEEYNYQLTGVELDIEPVRDYPHGEVAAHLLGYTGEITGEELAADESDEYRLGDIIGRMGAESAFERQLRGEWGGQQVEVNGAGRIIRILGEKSAKSGGNVTLTLDLELQKAAEAALGDRIGAIVALDPHTGGVLAMASRPTFDPNIFSGRITPETWQKLQAKDNPFVNRALRGFPPASTFKIVTATAGMESGQYPPNTVLNTYAYLNVSGVRFGEWNRAGFGPMGYVQALAWSSNTFFGQVGRGVGGEVLIDWARRYGFGTETTLELPAETSGLIADEAWKQERFDWGWSDGDTVNMSIGQGFTLATPLQVAVMFAVPANGGYRVNPHLLKTDQGYPPRKVSMNLKSSTVRTLQEGLRAVVSGGTGTAVRVPSLPPAAGKSGTAEAPPGKAHAWFGAYAPYNNPEIVVVAFAEHSGGGGGSVAAPMVREVLETYFNGNEKEKK
ncbi:peptidoglycan glycosyltransferase [Halothece sp. PCC 7418]|uniref:penicillin-binding protein 2 n=1 Tax=Halothece sp. (strain PCC 7418) TaxID=65093 RepID=UPI0002A06B68|nr:penicillin-binding protein 2 [Halothece sp. PCC 7418]AFZ44308.1 peptidoglycan glycosyltransferase [Halothece sp. PCC 7418]